MYDWLRFSLEGGGRLEGSNPLLKEPLEALPMSVAYDVDEYK
jgi:hypothetical protein